MEAGTKTASPHQLSGEEVSEHGQYRWRASAVPRCSPTREEGSSQFEYLLTIGLSLEAL